MCKISASQIAADGQAVGSALLNIAALLKTTDPTLSANLTSAANALIQVTSTWTEGSDIAILEDAENAVIVVLNLIPLTSPYAAFVAIAFTALNLLIANTQTQDQQTGDMLHDAHLLLAKAAQINTDSPWFGKAQIKHQWMRTPRKDFEAAWNGAVTAQPTLGVLKITL